MTLSEGNCTEAEHEGELAEDWTTHSHTRTRISTQCLQTEISVTSNEQTSARFRLCPSSRKIGKVRPRPTWTLSAFTRRLKERLAEQPRPVWAFFDQFSRFRLDPRVLRSHSFFTFKERMHVLKRKVRIFFILPANRHIECRSRTEQQCQCWEARMKRKAQAAECQDT